MLQQDQHLRYPPGHSHHMDEEDKGSRHFHLRPPPAKPVEGDATHTKVVARGLHVDIAVTNEPDLGWIEKTW